MKGKVIINNQEIEIEINEEQLEQLKIKKKTGYERSTGWNVRYYYEQSSTDTGRQCAIEQHSTIDNRRYDGGDYYNNSDLALNNIRADRLMRQLRRFAVENRKKELDWKDTYLDKWKIEYDHSAERFSVWKNEFIQSAFTIYFDSQETATAAIEKFKDELIWYFTEYKDSL